MMKQLSIAAALLLAVACKVDAPSSGSAPASDTNARSAKIEVKPATPRPQLPAAAPEHPAGQPAPDPAAEIDESQRPTTYPVVPLEVPPIADPPRADEDQFRGRNVWRKRRRLDTDHDGKVSEAELAANTQANMTAMHSRLDIDGDGILTADELASANGRMRFDNGATLDTNRDGDISSDELAAGIRARRGDLRTPPPVAAPPRPAAPVPAPPAEPAEPAEPPATGW